MKVFLANVMGVAGLKIFPETEAEAEYLTSLDFDLLQIRRVQHMDGSFSLNLQPKTRVRYAPPAKDRSSK